MPSGSEEMAVAHPIGPPKAMRILIVDGSAVDQMILAKLLRQAWSARSVHIDFAFGVESAIQQSLRTQYDLVVLDWRLPTQSGGDLLKWLRTNGQWMPCVVVSAWPQKLMPMDFESLGALLLSKDGLTCQQLRLASETAGGLVSAAVANGVSKQGQVSIPMAEPAANDVQPPANNNDRERDTKGSGKRRWARPNCRNKPLVGNGPTSAVLLLLWVGAIILPAQTSPLETERQHDQKMWRVMRQMLIDLGHSKKAVMLDHAWTKTLTPQQWADIEWPQPPQEEGQVWQPSAQVQRVAAVCGELAKPELSTALQQACTQTDDVRDVLLGLWLWTQQGGRPLLQQRADLALHFLSAALIEYHSGAGRIASLAKEEIDQGHGSDYDLDDLAAGFAGAEWIARIRADHNGLKFWASGQLSLERNLPPLQYGRGIPSPAMLEKLSADIYKAINLAPREFAKPSNTKLLDPGLQNPK